MERMKVCSICGENLPITEFSKKEKNRWRSYCKKCNGIKNGMKRAKEIEIPKLDIGEEIEVRGKMANGHKYSSYVPYEKALQMVNEKVAFIVHERLIRKYFNREKFRNLIFKRYGHKCFYCGEFANTIDHVIPRSKGGISSFSNCVPACFKCNTVKRNLDLEDFLYYFGPLTITPNLSKVDSVRYDLMELTDKMANINVYLNMCLKKIELDEDVSNYLFELEELEIQVEQIGETINRHIKENEKILYQENRL